MIKSKYFMVCKRYEYFNIYQKVTHFKVAQNRKWRGLSEVQRSEF